MYERIATAAQAIPNANSDCASGAGMHHRPCPSPRKVERRESSVTAWSEDFNVQDRWALTVSDATTPWAACGGWFAKRVTRRIDARGFESQQARGPAMEPTGWPNTCSAPNAT
jgi:hypothetical protein